MHILQAEGHKHSCVALSNIQRAAAANAGRGRKNIHTYRASSVNECIHNALTTYAMYICAFIALASWVQKARRHFLQPRPKEHKILQCPLRSIGFQVSYIRRDLLGPDPVISQFVG